MSQSELTHTDYITGILEKNGVPIAIKRFRKYKIHTINFKNIPEANDFLLETGVYL